MQSSWRRAHIFGLVLTAFLVINAFLPWALREVNGAQLATLGVEGDGVLILFIGLWVAIATVLSAFRFVNERLAALIAISGGVIALAIGAYNWVDIERAAGDAPEGVDIRVGIGVVMTPFLGAGIALNGYLGHWRPAERQSRERRRRRKKSRP